MNLAIVGAGAAGCAAACALRDQPVDVSVFERTNSVGGRAATRQRGDCTYDPGANYLKSTDDRVTDLVTALGDGPEDIAAPVWTLDADGDIAEGRDEDAHKWTYRSGVAALCERLLGPTDAAVESGARVVSLARDGDHWRLRGPEQEFGVFDAVLLTPPGPVTADILDESDWAAPVRDDLSAAADTVPYRTILTVVLRYEFAREYPWYALVNPDGDHPLGWLAREECKPGHIPDGSLLVAQMAPGWSDRRFDDPADEVAADAAALVADALDDDRYADPAWTDDARWQHALADGGVDGALVERAADHGLHVAGDWVAGEARLHAAVRSGLAAADRL